MQGKEQLMKVPTILKKLKLNSVDFVRRGANPAADIALMKSADMPMDDEVEIDVAKAAEDLTMFTEVLGESFDSIMKDDSLTTEDRLSMIEKSLSEFIDTVDDYLSPLSILEKSDGYLPEDEPQTANVTKKSSTTSKGDYETMANFENVDKSRLNPEEQAALDALIAKANGTEIEKEDEPAAGKVDPAKAQKEEEENADIPPAVKKALDNAMAEVENLRKSAEMRELEEMAKKYECLGKKASEEALVLYDMRKAGDAIFKSYIAALDTQVDIVEQSGLFAEIGKSGNFNYTAVAKSEPETKVESIAKSYMEKDPSMSYTDAVAKAWSDNPQLMAEYEENAGF